MQAVLIDHLAQLVLAILAALAIAILKKLANVADTRMHAGVGKDVALELVTQAETVVRTLDQTLKQELKVAQIDGELSRTDMQLLKSTGIKMLKDQMSNAALEVITKNSERLEDVLGRAIEAAVSKVNSQKPVELKGELLSAVGPGS